MYKSTKLPYVCGQMRQEVILVNELDESTGTMEKQEAHVKGLLHRAFSVLVYNSKGELLLQQRAFDKYHSAGLWTNTCCSHPQPGELTEVAAHRRLQEEMGFDCALKFQFTFIYKVKFEGELFEHELDHVFVGHHDQDPPFNPAEVAAFRWVDVAQLKEEVRTYPHRFTYWLKEILERI